MPNMIRRSFLIPVIALSLAACGEQAADSEPQTDRYADIGNDTGTATMAERPVQIGFDGPRFDACAGYGRVTNLNTSGDDYLVVRSAPAGSAEEVDQLGRGRGVSMCQKIGDWVGVVYAPESGEDETPVDCGTGSPVASVREYEGPCSSGWVNEDYIKLVAG